MDIIEIMKFYEKSFQQGQEVLRLILDDKENYIELKKRDPKWSELTLEMCKFNNQAFRLYSIMKHTFVNEKDPIPLSTRR